MFLDIYRVCLKIPPRTRVKKMAHMQLNERLDEMHRALWEAGRTRKIKSTLEMLINAYTCSCL